MSSPLIEQLLILQDYDMQAARLKSALAKLPLEIQGYEDKITEQKSMLEAAQEHCKELEVRRKDIDTQLKSSEEQIVKYKNQQLAVKKNEEYQALEHEIATATSEVGTLEDEELNLLMEIDEAKEALAKTESETSEAIGELQNHIARLREKEAECKAEIDQAVASYDQTKEKTDRKALSVYEVVKTGRKKPPYVVQVEGNTCSGCHLKISQENIDASKSGEKVGRCDNCGRIVYA